MNLNCQYYKWPPINYRFSLDLSTGTGINIWYINTPSEIKGLKPINMHVYCCEEQGFNGHQLNSVLLKPKPNQSVINYNTLWCEVQQFVDEPWLISVRPHTWVLFCSLMFFCDTILCTLLLRYWVCVCVCVKDTKCELAPCVINISSSHKNTNEWIPIPIISVQFSSVLKLFFNKFPILLRSIIVVLATCLEIDFKSLLMKINFI